MERFSRETPSLPHPGKLIDPHPSYCTCVSITNTSCGVLDFGGGLSSTAHPTGQFVMKQHLDSTHCLNL